MLTMMAGLAALEKDLIAERRTAGIKRAKDDGIHCGRPNKATVEDVQLLLEKGMTIKEVMTELSISRATFYRLKPAA